MNECCDAMQFSDDVAGVWVSVQTDMVKTHMATGRNTPPPQQHLPWLTFILGREGVSLFRLPRKKCPYFTLRDSATPHLHAPASFIRPFLRFVTSCAHLHLRLPTATQGRGCTSNIACKAALLFRSVLKTETVTAEIGLGWYSHKTMTDSNFALISEFPQICINQARLIIFSPQMKHVVFRISSFFCFSLLRSANVSMMTPKMRLRTMMMTMKKKSRS